MKDKITKHRRRKTKRQKIGSTRTFRTVEQVDSHFSLTDRVATRFIKGRDRGIKVAEDALTRVLESAKS